MNDDAQTTHLQVLEWGLLPYGEAMKLQEALVCERMAEISRTVSWWSNIHR